MRTSFAVVVVVLYSWPLAGQTPAKRFHLTATLDHAEREIGARITADKEPYKEPYKTAHVAALKAFSLVEILGPKKNSIQFKADAGSLAIRADGKPLATYIHRDPKTPRPYFAQLHTPDGVQVSRNHPPVAGKDATDHAELHPGLWLAFGDVSGADNWRLKAHVKHDKLIQEPMSDGNKASFAVRNLCFANDGKKVICEETCRITIYAKPAGHLLSWDSQFRSADGEFSFGDQEEMGLGVRLATALTVKAGGQILTGEGHKNEKQVRGKSSPWCDYSGTIDGKRVGVTLMQHPKNFRPAWYHARDYGLLVLNPFGRNALTGGERSRVTVKQGETLRLRYGVFLHGDADPAAAYRDYLAAEPDA